MFFFKVFQTSAKHSEMPFFCTVAYWRSGEGQAEQDPDTNKSRSFNTEKGSHFAPNAVTGTSLQARLRQRLGQPLKISVPDEGPVAQITQACSVGHNSGSKSSKGQLTKHPCFHRTS
jgi:hypothetical protein